MWPVVAIASARHRQRPCPATASPSNTTARRSSAGSARRMGRSVQGALTEAIASFSGEQARVRGAGRTDAGVHALGQVAHFDLARDWPPVTRARGRQFPPQARRRSRCSTARVAARDFDARFSATARHYRYRILARPRPARARPQSRVVGAAALDAEAMARGRAGAGRPARLHDLPRRRLPGEIAASRPSTGSRYRGTARRSSSRPRRARSCTTRCARWSAA